MTARGPEKREPVSDKVMRENMAQALIALGGNVGDARATVDRAVAAFCDGDVVRLLARSSDYRTPPWGVEDQPPFVNACIAVATSLGPRDLLARALEVERAFGRDRAGERRWGPRPLDIDLIAYDDVTLDGPDLILPHPRLFERAFVLVPLVEIAPGRRIAGVRVADALARLDTAGIERLPPRSGGPVQ
jgi:2-amino-4-hydroxy-6-hydroxymethyldihydropteridine diphosphokinase